MQWKGVSSTIYAFVDLAKALKKNIMCIIFCFEFVPESSKRRDRGGDRTESGRVDGSDEKVVSSNLKKRFCYSDITCLFSRVHCFL